MSGQSPRHPSFTYNIFPFGIFGFASTTLNSAGVVCKQRKAVLGRTLLAGQPSGLSGRLRYSLASAAVAPSALKVQGGAHLCKNFVGYLRNRCSVTVALKADVNLSLGVCSSLGCLLLALFRCCVYPYCECAIHVAPCADSAQARGS